MPANYLRRLTMLSFLFSAAAIAQPDNLYTHYSTQAATIYERMTLDERIGELLLPSYVLLASSMSPNGKSCQQDINNPNTPKKVLLHDCGLDQIAKYHLGAVLTGGGPYYNAPTLENWAQLNNWASEQHRLGNPRDPLLLTGNDAIHGNMHLSGAVIFPHNIGLGAAHDPELVKNIGHLVGQDSLASGFNWVYMPTLAVAQDLRWGRAYESFSQEPALVKAMAFAYVSGFQNIQDQQLTGPLANAKHFIGDGATQYGFDEGDDAYQGTAAHFWEENGQGYEGALNADVGSIMVSYSAINGNNTRMHFGGQWDIVNQFKNTGIMGTDRQLYQFSGFMVSDWNGPTRAAYFYDQDNKTVLTLPEIMAKTINSGVDMIMLGQGDTTNPFDPNSPPNFSNVGEVFTAIKTAYLHHQISDARLKDAVTRILAVKLAMAPKAPADYSALQTHERETALTAAEESLVLLKNSNQQKQAVLPLSSTAIKNVIFVGDTNDLGLQNGGWTVNWQGQKSDIYFQGKDKISSGAMTLEEGIKSTLGSGVHYYSLNGTDTTLKLDTFKKQDTVVIVLVSEFPYAEFMGDIGNDNAADDWYDMGAKYQYNLYAPLKQLNNLSLMFGTEASSIQQLRAHGVKVITVVYSGRPVILTEDAEHLAFSAPLNNSDAVIAAFLPGTLGGKALANALFGNYHFRTAMHGQSNTLTFPWPRNEDDIANHFKEGALFPIGYGLKD